MELVDRIDGLGDNVVGKLNVVFHYIESEVEISQKLINLVIGWTNFLIFT
jgi:hypothetical protein